MGTTLKRVTRLAPSPTGALHLGNARTFMINWAIARQDGWGVVLRIEDLDTPRVKEGAAREAIDDLAWLGMDWDEGPCHQLDDLSPYREALELLDDKGLTYPCVCTRSEITAAQSAPHGDEHELRYPGTCRPTSRPPADATGDDRPTAIRVVVPDEAIVYEDVFAGPQSFNVQQQVGDFIVASKAGLPAYQLAVVVDDARQGITDIVRGDDLLGSAARQALLYRLLDLGEPPRYCHLPLVLGEDGRRLAKRHGDTRIAMYRDAGVSPRRLIGLLGYWCGIITERAEMTAETFRDRLTLGGLPNEPITMTAEDDAWLRRGWIESD